MDTSKVVLFYEKCRLCLEEPGACCMFEIEDLPQDIFSCTGVQVSSNDNLPQMICTKCANIVSKAKELRLLATVNDSHLKLLFDEIGETEVPAAVDDLPSTSKACSGDKIKHNKVNKVKPQSEAKCSFDTKNRNCDTMQPKTISVKKECETMKPKISVKKDLFESSPLISVSNKVRRKEEFDGTGRRKRIKWETDTTVHVCETCSKTYETWKKLYLHMRLHNKTLACPLDGCGKKFATKGDLEKHLRVHTGVKPYQCHICDKRFTQQCTLKAHKENMH